MSAAEVHNHIPSSDWGKYAEPLLWSAVIVSVALFAIAVGHLCSPRAPSTSKWEDSALYHNTHMLDPLAISGAVIIPWVALYCISLLCAYRHTHNKSCDLSFVRKTLFTAALFITLLAIGMIIKNSNIKNSDLFSYEKNTHFCSREEWHSIEKGITTALTAGSILLSVGVGLGALALFSVLPEKIYHWIKAREHKASVNDAKKIAENPPV